MRWSVWASITQPRTSRIATNLQKRPLPPPDHKLQLLLHRQRAHNRRLNRTNQILPLPTILQNNRKRIIRPSTLLPQHPRESRHTSRLPKQQQRLINTVRAETVQHALAGDCVGGSPVLDPVGVVHVVVVLEFGDGA